MTTSPQLTLIRTRTACPPWCAVHPAHEPTAHQSAGWRHDGLGLSVVIEQDDAAPTVCATANVMQDLDLSEDQAHELGMALVRAADQLRRARTQAPR